MHYAALVDWTAQRLAAAIGGRVRQERQSRQWTLDQLAEKAAVSRRVLINVEQGSTNPSIATLLRIGDALGIGLPALVEPPVSTRVKVVRHGEGAALWSGDAGGRGVLVAGTGPPDVIELWDWTLGAGDRHVSEAHSPGTKELLQVREGTVTIEVADESIVLTVGDAVTFSGDVTHSYANPDTVTAGFTLAVFEPAIGAKRRTEPTDA